MKKLLLIICVAFFVASSYAQEPESKMKYVYSFDEALQKAKKENKLIFFNCYADWVVTCHGMDKLVFSDEAFANYMDKNFVNLFIDVSIGDNKFLAEKYKISFFAHYLILDADGEIVHRIVGGAKLPLFQENIAMALNPKTSLRGMTKRYEGGENSVKFFREYLKVLSMASEDEKYNEVVKQFLTKINKKDWSKAENWSIMIREIKRSKENEYFQYLLANKAQFVKNIGADVINKVIAAKYLGDIFAYVIGSTDYNVNTIGVERLKLNKADLPENDICYRLLDLAKLRGEKRYEEMVQSIQTDFKDGEERMLDAINMSMREIRDATPAQKKCMIDYLTEAAKTKKGSTLREYEYSISQIEEFKGIEFFKGTFAEALVVAKKENKLIFLDCYTTWCGPCKMLSSQVFTQKEVGLYFNENFINVKMDMERGEGVELSKKFNITSYPTLLLIDGDGKMVHKVLGGSDAKTFLDKMKRGTVRETSYGYLVENIDANRDNPVFYINYLIARAGALEIPDMAKQITDYLSTTKNITEIATPEIMSDLSSYLTDYRNPVVIRIVENANEFKTKLGNELFSQSMERIFFPVVLKYVKGEESEAVYDEVRGLITKMKLENSASLNYAIAIADLYKTRDIDKLLVYYEHTISKITDAQMKLNLDLLLSYSAKSSTLAQKEKARAYIVNAKSKADPRAIKGYNSLLDNLR